MNNNSVRITNWLRRELTTEKPSGEVVRFELRHLPIGSKRGQEVAAPWIVPSPCNIVEWVENTAAEIMSAAENEAEGIASGAQRYILVVFRSKTPDKNVGRLAFMIAAPDADEEGEIESEPATKQGMAAMQMRHNEALMRLLLTSMGGMMQSQAKMVAAVSQENEKLRDARMETITVVEELLSQREQREIDKQKGMAQVRLLEEGGKKLAGLLPAVINRMSGGKLDTRVALAGSFLDGLSETQRGKLMQAFGTLELDETQQIAAGELLQSLNNH